LQSVQAYISPPIAAVFLLGVFWPRANRHGAITALAAGAALGAIRFVLELNRTSGVAQAALIRPLVEMNFLHFAVVLFVVSTVLLVVVSLATEAESLARLRGLTFATLDGYLQRSERSKRLFPVHVLTTTALALVVIGLWIHFA
jgi:SSS family solute:Na+ symporter